MSRGVPPLEPPQLAILIKNGSFSWDEKVERPTLSSINLDVLLFSSVAVVGGAREGNMPLIYKVIIVLVALTVVEVANGHPALSPASGPGPVSTISIPSERIHRPETFYGRHPFSRLQILAICLIGGLALLVIALVTACIHKRTALPPQPIPTMSLTSPPIVTMAIGAPSPYLAVAEAGPQEQPMTEIEM